MYYCTQNTHTTRTGMLQITKLAGSKDSDYNNTTKSLQHLKQPFAHSSNRLLLTAARGSRLTPPPPHTHT